MAICRASTVAFFGRASRRDQLTCKLRRFVGKRESRNSKKCPKPPSARCLVAKGSFIENGLRDEQTIVAAPAPPTASDLLVGGHDDINSFAHFNS